MNIQSHVTILIYAYSQIVNCYIWINQTQLYQNDFNTSSNFLNSDNDIHISRKITNGMLNTVCLRYSQSTKCNIGYFFDITRRICLGNKSSIRIILYTKI